MPGRTRAATLFAVLFLFLSSIAAWSSDNALRTDKKTVFTAEVIAASGTATSVAFTALGQAKDVSIQIIGAGTAPNYTVEILSSIDETNFVKPETGGTVGTFTDANRHIAAVAVPFCKAMKVKVTNNNAVNGITIDSDLASQ